MRLFFMKKTVLKITCIALSLLGVLFVSCEQPPGVIRDEDAALRSLTVDAGTLSPAFSASRFEYAITVRSAVDSITVTAEPNSSKATVSGAGTKTLAEGNNTVTIVVKAENGDSKTYTITVKRLEASVKEIETADDMAKIGVEEDWSLAASYFLVNDITLENWKPIIGSDNETPFSGEFDGNNQTITLNSFDNDFVGAYAYNNGTKYTNVFMGIFGAVKGSVSAKAEIKDLTINSSVNVAAANQIADSGVGVGLLAGYAEMAIFDNITLTGSFDYKYGGNNGSAYLGGITGFIIGKGTVIKNCTSSMAMNIQPGYGKAQIVPGNANAFSFVGGFAGFFKDGGAIENCHNTGSISAISDVSASQVMVGGILGGSHYSFSDDPHGYIADCSSTGDIEVFAKGFWPMAGGIAGVLAGGTDTLEGSTHIVRCFASGTISLAGTAGTGQWPYLGGIVGYIYVGAKVSQCYFNGTVIVGSGNDYTGGIAGYSSYATGFNDAKNNPCLIEDCWSTGEVKGYNNAGGIVGQNQQNTLLKRNYSLMNISVINGGTSSAAQWGIGGIAGSHSSTRLADAMEACVALNASIYTPKGDEIHRIGGRMQAASGVFPKMKNVYALPDLLPVTDDADKTYTMDKGTDRPDGADIPNNYLSGGKPTQAFFESIGWDFVNVWKMGSDGYPKLKWQ
jgi:hypothetical protein